MIFSPDDTHRLLFIEVPDAKVVKNRLHLDLSPTDGTRDEEVGRLVALGATVVADRVQALVRAHRPRGERVLRPAQRRSDRGGARGG